MLRSKLRILCVTLLLLWIVSSLSVSVFADKPLPIRIGATVSREGKYVQTSLMMSKAFSFWIESVNGRGGLLGRPVELITYDDKSNTELTEKLYRKLIEEDKVDFVFSPYSSPLTLVASKVSEKSKKLMLAVAAAAEAPWKRGYRYLFQLYAPAQRQFIGVLDIMARNKYRKLAIIFDETSVFNQDIVKGIRHWAKVFRLQIVFDEAYSDGKRDLPAIVDKLKALGIDGLINSSYPPDSYELIRLLEKAKFKPKVLAMPIVPAYPNFPKKVGPYANYILGPSQWEPIDRIPFPGTRSFMEGFKTHTGLTPTFHSTAAYAACQLMEEAIKKVGALDNTKMRDYIAALDTVTVLGRFKVNPAGMQVGHNSFIIQWQNGKKEIVWPRKMQTARPRF